MVTFVCLHGAGKSRVAAALFNASAPPGWRATSAGLEPQAEPSPATAPMLAAEPAALAKLDHSNPRALEDDDGDVVIGIDCDISGAQHWRLVHQWPEAAVLDELRTLTADLISDLGEGETRESF
ncbi:MAG TPA: hypothetical protein VFC19_24515 [Candidatus Limnocylindrales bacterium]|nr:hypothetical protein [Candidatus Limnocylindrales bacterium]